MVLKRFLALVVGLTVLCGLPVEAQEGRGVVVSVGTLVEGMSCLADPSQTYTLYLPSGYSKEKKYPVLLIFDPQGRSRLAAELFEAAAKQWGWILISSDFNHNEAPRLDAVSAFLPEIRDRFAADPDRIYAAGFSAGGEAAYMLAKSSAEIAGVILCGIRFLPDQQQDTSFAVFSAVGDLDGSFYHMKALDESVGNLGNSHRFEVFNGADSWMPSELASSAIAWFEIEAMRNELRPRDHQVIRQYLDNEMLRALDLERRGQLIAALRQFNSIVRTYTEIADTSEAQIAVRDLEGEELVLDAVEEEEKLRSFEERNLAGIDEAFAEFLEDDSPMTMTRLRRKLGIASLERKASKDGAEAAVARRLLEIAYSRACNRLSQEMLSTKRYGHARSLLELSSSIFADRPAPWYGLACVQAQLGNLEGAVEALESAVQRGFDQVDLLDGETMLDPLRDTARFEELVDGLRSD